MGLKPSVTFGLDGVSAAQEKLPVIIRHYPHYESVNAKIVRDSLFANFKEGEEVHMGEFTSNIRASQTVSRRIHSESIDKIYNWIITILHGSAFLRIFDFTVDNAWLAVYNKGEYTNKHSHYPYPFSFVYFVKSPKGSSPLVFSSSGKRIKPEEGKGVIFPGSLFHHVPKNNCDGRIVLAGNLWAIQREHTQNYSFEDI